MPEDQKRDEVGTFPAAVCSTNKSSVFPRATKNQMESGWILSVPFLKAIQEICRANEDPAELETIETILLAVEAHFVEQ